MSKIQCSCHQCGVVVFRVPSQIKEGRKVFCNNSCAATFLNKLRRKTVVCCLHCEQSFNCNPYVKNSKKFCSKECMQAYRMLRKVIVQCVSCNKDILCSKTRPRKFCSGSCRNNFNNKVIKGTRSKVETLFEKELNLKFPKLEFNLNDRQILDGLELDFYFPSLGAAIEFNGVWHLKPIRGEEKLKATQQRDIAKALQCKEKNIKLLTLVDEKSSQKSIQLQVNTAIEFIEKIISN